MAGKWPISTTHGARCSNCWDRRTLGERSDQTTCEIEIPHHPSFGRGHTIDVDGNETTMMSPSKASRDDRLTATIRRYFDACNRADVEAIIGCFAPNAVHYFPPGFYGGPLRGARTIAERWRAAVQETGNHWTVDRIVSDQNQNQAAIEWTLFKTKSGQMMRGAEWYEFDPSSGLITEVKVYYPSIERPIPERVELASYDYGAKGYPLTPPPRTLTSGS